MRWFFGAIGVLAWIWALAVLWIFKESGGALTMIAAGTFAVVAVVALGCERILKTLEEIRDGASPLVRSSDRIVRDREVVKETRHAPAV
jgi:hypothetical protein